MRHRVARAFTLVELLVVIGIIGVLLAILLPALSRARQAANTAKCSANLHNIGAGIADYIAESRGYLPACYTYVGQQLNLTAGTETPTTAQYGYVNWSSYLFADGRADRFYSTVPIPGIVTAIAVGTPGPYSDAGKWGMFQCPSLDEGGLPPTDTVAGNKGPANLQNDAVGFVDYQAPRLAYTLNEALCPRNKFVPGFQGCVRTSHYVRSTQVRESQSTILATEWNTNPSAVQGVGEVSGAQVVKSHRPLNGYVGLQSFGNAYVDLVDVPPGAKGTILHATVNLMAPDPSTADLSNSKTRLDWVGRNHGPKALDGKGWDLRKSVFLYLDGHAEAKNVRDTLSPWQWGHNVYGVYPNDDVLDQ